MIDYEKLKLAHELAYKRCECTGGRVDVTCCFFDTNVEPEYHFVDYTSDADRQCFCMDDLIFKLQELTGELKSKYKVGQEVWVLDANDFPLSSRILGVDINCNYRYLIIANDSWYTENDVYPSRESLIEAQIEYWNKLRYPTIEESTTKAQESITSLGSILMFQDNAPKFACPKCDKEWSLCKCKLECDHKYVNISETMASCIKCQYELKICQHESDNFGKVYSTGFLMNKCKKCGEFYR